LPEPSRDLAAWCHAKILARTYAGFLRRHGIEALVVVLFGIGLTCALFLAVLVAPGWVAATLAFGDTPDKAETVD
jgi:hypothetical protein